MLHRTNSFSCFQIVSLFRCTITHRFAKWYKITLLSNDTGTLTANIIVLLPYEITLLSNDYSSRQCGTMFYYLMKLHYYQTSNENKLRHYNSQGNIIKWLYYKPKIIFLQQFRTYLYPKYKDFLAEVSESCFDFQ